MKKTVLSVILLFWTLSIFSQFTAIEPVEEYRPTTAITAGILQGGGSLIGFDIEKLFAKNVGIQFGAGLVGFGAGLNFHFRPDIRSSFISMQYWHQGFGSSYTQSIMSGNFVFRARKIFTFQIGLGFPLEQGPAWPEETMAQPPVMLTYAVGVYFPF